MYVPMISRNQEMADWNINCCLYSMKYKIQCETEHIYR